MQTNKEFCDEIAVRSEDLFLAVAIRRVAARQLRMSVVDLETKTVGLSIASFAWPWDSLDFIYQLEKELNVSISRSDCTVSETVNVEDWRYGPAIRMPMGDWTKFTIDHVLAPVRSGISCPPNWTSFESEGCVLRHDSWINRLVFQYLPYVALILAAPGIFWRIWFEWVVPVCVTVLILCWVLPILLLITGALFARLTQKSSDSKSHRAELPPLLLGTLTFRNGRLRFADDETPQWTAEILPGDYRFFLFNIDDGFEMMRAVLTTLPEPPPFEEIEAGEGVQKFELCCESSLIGISEADDDGQEGIVWIPAPQGDTVRGLRQGTEGNVCGIKLAPRYGVGENRIFVQKTATAYSVIIELDIPDENGQWVD